MLLNQYIAFCYSEQFIANFIPCFLQFSFGLPSPAKFLPKTRRDSRRDLGEILKSRRDSRRDLGKILKSKNPPRFSPRSQNLVEILGRDLDEISKSRRPKTRRESRQDFK